MGGSSLRNAHWPEHETQDMYRLDTGQIGTNLKGGQKWRADSMLRSTKSGSTTQAEKRKISKYSLSKVGFKNVTLQNFLAPNSTNNFAELYVRKIFCEITNGDGTFDLPNDDDVNVSWSLCWRVILAPPRVLCPNTNKYRTPLLA